MLEIYYRRWICTLILYSSGRNDLGILLGRRRGNFALGGDSLARYGGYVLLLCGMRISRYYLGAKATIEEGFLLPVRV